MSHSNEEIVPFGVEEPKSSIQKIKEHFTGGTSDAEAFAEKELGQLMDKELTEQLLIEYLKAATEKKDVLKHHKTLRAEIVALAKKDRGAIRRGGHVLIIEDRAPRYKINWERFMIQTYGKADLDRVMNDLKLVKDGAATCAWIEKIGDEEDSPSVEIEVKKVTG